MSVIVYCGKSKGCDSLPNSLSHRRNQSHWILTVSDDVSNILTSSQFFFEKFSNSIDIDCHLLLKSKATDSAGVRIEGSSLVVQH